MLWLVPFNSIHLRASLPIDLQLDRLVLPVMVVFWIAALVARGPYVPRLRLTPIHVAVLAFVALSFVSVLVNFEVLNIAREFGVATKKLALLMSYAIFFVFVASVVRTSEVRAFMYLTIGLACLASLGTIYEYRSDVNVFYDWTAALLPGQFNMDLAGDGLDAFDAQGRRLIQGPTQHGLEIATMLAMALPMAVVELLRSANLRRRAVFALAIGLIFAGCVSTYRKTGIIAPVAALAMLALLRPAQMVKLVPLGLVIVAMVHALSPGALGSVFAQLKPDRLDSQSVNHRKADYDAVHPDVFNHPAVGRGYGTYDPHRYRIIDNEYLLRLIETGFLGLAAYLGLILAVVGANLRTVRRGDPLRAPPALAAAGAAVAFLTASALFDVMSFPHAPYIFLSIAGLAAVCVMRPEPAPVPAGLTPVPATWRGAPRTVGSP